MRDVFPVLRVLGVMVAFMSLSMALPLGISWWWQDGATDAFLGAMLLTAAAGTALWAGTQRFRRELQPRHGVMLVSLAWMLLPVFAAVPLLMAFHDIGRPMSFTHAYFEAVSGLTTTGGTVVTKIDTLPLSVNVWRTFLQWVGGMGILILAVAVLPLLGVGGSQLFKAEAAGPIKDTKLTPRVAETAKGLWGVYATLSIACFLAYWAGGMPPMDALMHMFTTVSLGGLSSHDASLGYFQSPLLEAICIAFMLFAACNFALYFTAVRKGRVSVALGDPELRATLTVLVAGGLLAAVLLWGKGIYAPLEALRHGMFHVVSIGTTTGYATQDYLLWPTFLPMFMLLLSGVASSAGSTGGGIKMVRLLILLQQARREMRRLAHPRAVQPVRLGQSVVEAPVIFAVLAFMLVYGATVIGLSMVLMLTDLDPVTAFSAVLASVNCMGPGLGAVGPASSFAVLTDFQIWVCTLGMLMGRLELLSFMALLTPSFWRR